MSSGAGNATSTSPHSRGKRHGSHNDLHGHDAAHAAGALRLTPLSEDIDSIKRMEDAGAAAVVLYSLFEEQIIAQRHDLHHHLTHGTESFAEALTYFPAPPVFNLAPKGYLEHIRRAKAAVDIPIITSLNGVSIGGWTDYATQMQQAGADALELNVYYIPTDADLTGEQVEATYLDILSAVKNRGEHSRGDETESVFQQYGSYGPLPGPGGCRCTGVVQSLLPTRHRPGDA